MFYSFRRLQLFVEVITKRKRRDLLSITIAMRQSQGTDGAKFKEFLKSLEDE
jgi:hypothetical protein